MLVLGNWAARNGLKRVFGEKTQNLNVFRLFVESKYISKILGALNIHIQIYIYTSSRYTISLYRVSWYMYSVEIVLCTRSCNRALVLHDMKAYILSLLRNNTNSWVKGLKDSTRGSLGFFVGTSASTSVSASASARASASASTSVLASATNLFLFKIQLRLFFPSETSSYIFKTNKVSHFGQFWRPKPSSIRCILVLHSILLPSSVPSALLLLFCWRQKKHRPGHGMDIYLNLGLRLSVGSRLSFSVNLGLGVSHKPVSVQDPASSFFPFWNFFLHLQNYQGSSLRSVPTSKTIVYEMDPGLGSFYLPQFLFRPCSLFVGAKFFFKKKGGVLAHLLLSSWGCQKLPALRQKNCLSSVYVPSSTLRLSFAPAQKKHASPRPIFSAFKEKILCKICQAMVQFGFGLAPQSLLTFFSMGSLRTIIPVSKWLNIFSYLH